VPELNPKEYTILLPAVITPAGQFFGRWKSSTGMSSSVPDRQDDLQLDARRSRDSTPSRLPPNPKQKGFCVNKMSFADWERCPHLPRTHTCHLPREVCGRCRGVQVTDRRGRGEGQPRRRYLVSIFGICVVGLPSVSPDISCPRRIGRANHAIGNQFFAFDFSGEFRLSGVYADPAGCNLNVWGRYSQLV
jgi:hypothetical protein